MILTEFSTFFSGNGTGREGGQPVVPVRFVERGWIKMRKAGQGLFEGGLVLDADDDQRVRFCRGVRVLQGGFMRSVVGLNENLLERQIVTNESVNPVFVLQHDFLRGSKVLHFADRTASKTAPGAFGVCVTPSHLVSPP